MKSIMKRIEENKRKKEEPVTPVNVIATIYLQVCLFSPVITGWRPGMPAQPPSWQVGGGCPGHGGGGVEGSLVSVGVVEINGPKIVLTWGKAASLNPTQIHSINQSLTDVEN
jgi:hypothetical protein